MTYDQSGSFDGAMSALNLNVDEVDQDYSSMPYPQLAEAKSRIEASLDTLFSLLHDVYKFDMESPLTRDGFPRSDIDVVSIRLVRTKIIRSRNDHSKVMQRIGSLLSEQLQSNAANPNFNSIQETPINPTPNRFARIPFAGVRSVAPNSPAERAGLKVGDRITIFDGNINATNHEKLTEIAARVKSKEEKHIEVLVLRDTSLVTLELVPTSTWEGRGLLGCHIVPV